MNFIYGNDTKEDKIMALQGENNGRLDLLTLKDNYKGVQVLDLYVPKAELTVKKSIKERKYHTCVEGSLKTTHCRFCFIQ